MSEEEVTRPDEEIASKATADDESVVGSSPTASAKKGRPKKVEDVEVLLYKLYFRRPNGLIRAEISKSVIYTLNVDWPDLIKVIPSDRWVTQEEILNLVKQYENASPRKSIIRSDEAIKSGINFLVDAGILLTSR